MQPLVWFANYLVSAFNSLNEFEGIATMFIFAAVLLAELAIGLASSKKTNKEDWLIATVVALLSALVELLVSLRITIVVTLLVVAAVMFVISLVVKMRSSSWHDCAAEENLALTADQTLRTLSLFTDEADEEV